MIVRKCLLSFKQYGPYHLARLRETSAFFNSHGDQIEGLELSAEQTEYDWRRHSPEGLVLHRVAEDRVVESTPLWHWPLQVWRTLNRLRPDTLFIAGYAHPAWISMLVWAKFQRKAVILMSDSKRNDAPRNILVERAKSWIVRQFDAAVTASEASKAYLVELGLPSDRIFQPYDVVDNAAFARPHEICASKAPYFLCNSRFLARKNIPALIRAFALYRRRCAQLGLTPYELRICGSGPELHAIQKTLADESLESCVHLMGFVQERELLPILHEAQAVIQPSLVDMWVLAVNEAMAAQVPCLVSSHCGCVPDLAEDGKTAWIFDPTSEDAMHQALLAFHQTPMSDRFNRASAAHHRVETRYGLRQFAEALHQAVRVTRP